LHYIQHVTQAIPPSSALPLPTAPASGGEGAGANGQSFAASANAAVQGAAPATSVAATSGPASAAQVASIVAATQAALADTVNLSPQAQQAVKMEAFNQLIANLVNQIQSGAATLPANWPTQGVSPQLQALLSNLLQQATAGQPLPQQLVSVQAWPTALTNAVLQLAAAQGNAGATPHAAADGAPALATAQPRGNALLPALQNWLVQQGVVQGTDGDRAFTLTLRVPVAWAQAQAALASALPGASSAGAGGASAMAGAAAALMGASQPTAAGMPQLGHMLQLPFAGSVQQLASGSMGLVMQPQVLPGSPAAAAAQAMRTSAILQLEFQPLAQAAQSAQAASILMPAHLLPQDVQAMLQGKHTDPWLLMAQVQAEGKGQKQSKNGNEQNSQFCNRAGCQYQGRAMCAQPFCAEMNYLWSVDRAQRSRL